MRRNQLLVWWVGFGFLSLSTPILLPADLKLGIVGTDGSHSVAFTRLLNDAADPEHVPGARIVAAYKSASLDIADSRDYVEKTTDELKTKWGLEFEADIPSLCRKVDGVLLLAIDGRVHLDQAKEVIAAGKPMFIDKPLASTIEDALEIARLAKEAQVPWFSSSALRYASTVTNSKVGHPTSVIAWGPGELEEHHQLDLSWYAIHTIEMLYVLMGRGCEDVTRISVANEDVLVGRWADGRIGTIHAVRPHANYGFVVVGPNNEVSVEPKIRTSYAPLIREIVHFFETGVPPVVNDETLELFAFMDAAQRSKREGGMPVPLRALRK